MNIRNLINNRVHDSEMEMHLHYKKLCINYYSTIIIYTIFFLPQIFSCIYKTSYDERNDKNVLDSVRAQPLNRWEKSLELKLKRSV